jgi:type III secretion system YscD/HrpQ family protein
MVAKLVAEEGDLKGVTLSLEEGEHWVIGRDPDECQIVVEDPSISRKHLLARRTSEGILVENLSSTNPVQINDEDISTPRLLQQGDTLKIGNELFRFYEDDTAQLLNNGHQAATNEGPPPHQFSFPSAEEEPNHFPPSEEDPIHPNNTLLEDEKEKFPLAEIDFGIADTGRWLLKVIGGPNNGAEFHMQTGHTYLLGTDPHACDIVFQDTSVSRQHARISISDEDVLNIEDLRSRNGVVIDGKPIEGRQQLPLSVIVTMGTTSFVVYDREGEMQTIISPLLPSIVKVLQQEESAPKKEEALPIEMKEPEKAPLPVVETPPPKASFNWHNLIPLFIISGILGLGGFGLYNLFKDEPVVVQQQEDPNALLQQALAPFPSIKYSFNKSTGGLLLLGHVLTGTEKSQLMYNLQGLKFIKFIDDSGVIIDEYAWQEINSVLSRNPAWRGITIHSPSAGYFVVSGYLQTRKQAEQLSDQISVNFPYVDLLENKVIVEEDVTSQLNLMLQQHNLRHITAQMANGEVTFSGDIPADKVNDFSKVYEQAKTIPGVRLVRSLVKTNAPEMGIINISDIYQVTGQSRLGEKYTVVINGRIVSEGDLLDGMVITSITPQTIFLEKDGNKYRIDYNK